MDKSVDAVDNIQENYSKKAILGIFAKQPIPGAVKTRLCPPLKIEEAANLYLESLQETVQRMQSGTGYELVICYAGERSWFAETFPGVFLVAQQGEDLGGRMANALNGFLRQGYHRAVLVGSDAPDLPHELVAQAFSALEQDDVVLGPAEDGGYYLVGESVHYPQLFENIEWSTGNVLPETLRRIAAHNISATQLSSWDDLDDLAALERFLKRSPASRTTHYLKTQLAEYFETL